MGGWMDEWMDGLMVELMTRLTDLKNANLSMQVVHSMLSGVFY